MAVSECRIDHLLLKDEIEQFLYQEAELLDERQFEDWLDLLWPKSWKRWPVRYCAAKHPTRRIFRKLTPGGTRT